MIAGTCTYCDQWAEPAWIVGGSFGNSGPGLSIYAHPACAGEHGARPWPEFLDRPAAPPTLRLVGADITRTAATPCCETTA